MPLESNGVCIVATQTGVSGGTSGGFGPCPIGSYAEAYVCVACTGVSEFVDGALAINCLLSCNSGFIYSS